MLIISKKHEYLLKQLLHSKNVKRRNLWSLKESNDSTPNSITKKSDESRLHNDLLTLQTYPTEFKSSQAVAYESMPWDT